MINFTNITPANPDLVIKVTDPADNNVVTALGVTPERANQLAQQLNDASLANASGGNASTHEMIAVASRIAKTVPELAFMVFALGVRQGEPDEIDDPETINNISYHVNQR